MDRDDLIETQTDEKVMASLTAHLAVSITTVVDGVIQAHFDRFKESLKVTIERTVRELIDARLKPYEEKVTQLSIDNGQLMARSDQLETYTRADNLTIHGPPETSTAERV